MRFRNEDRTRHRWLHANMRLRLRYGIEISIEDYIQLCADFGRGKGVYGRRVSPASGDEEGWVKIGDTWVCAHYKARERLIATFMPCPPLLVTAEIAAKLAAEGKLSAEGVGAKTPIMPPSEASAAGVARSDSQQQAARTRREKRREKHEEEVKALTEARKEDLSWFKITLGRVRDRIRQGFPGEAADIADAAASLPRNFHPGANPEETERVMARRIDQERKARAEYLARAS